MRQVDDIWEDVDPTKNYSIAMISYDTKEYSNYALEHRVGEKSVHQVFREYVKKKSPISQLVEGRIIVKYPGIMRYLTIWHEFFHSNNKKGR